MTQYGNTVQRQRLLLEAEKWAECVKNIHCHPLSSMWYDDRPQDTNNGKEHVMDIEYNSGIIERSKDGKHLHTFGKRKTGDELIDAYRKNTV